MAPDINDTLADLERTLADLEGTLMDHGRAAEAIDLAKQADEFDAEDATVADLMSYLESNDDIDDELLADAQNAAEMLADEMGTEDMADLTIDALEQHIADTDEDPEDPEDDPEDDEPVTMEDLNQVEEVVGEVATKLSDISELLTQREQDREETLETLERRLSEVEDTPVMERTLTGETPDDGETFYSVDDGGDESQHEDAYL